MEGVAVAWDGDVFGCGKTTGLLPVTEKGKPLLWASDTTGAITVIQQVPTVWLKLSKQVKAADSW